MKRITISVPDDVAQKAQRAVSAGHAPNVSTYFATIAAREPDWALARAAIDAMIEEAGGLAAEDYARARQLLDLPERELIGR